MSQLPLWLHGLTDLDGVSNRDSSLSLRMTGRSLRMTVWDYMGCQVWGYMGCQIWTVLSSLAEAISLLSGDHATALTPAVCWEYVIIRLPVWASQT